MSLSAGGRSSTSSSTSSSTDPAPMRHLMFRIRQVTYPPRNTKFTGYAVFTANYADMATTDVSNASALTMANVAPFCGRIFSMRRYYVFSAKCRWADTREGRMFEIKQVVGVQRVTACADVVRELITEAAGTNISEHALRSIVNQVRGMEQNGYTGDALIEQVRVKLPAIYKLMAASDYIQRGQGLAYTQIFPRRDMTRMLPATIALRFVELKADPWKQLLLGIDDWEKSSPVVERLISAVPALAAVEKELHVFRAIVDYRHRTDDTTFTVGVVIKATGILHVVSNAKEVGTLFEKLVTLGILYKWTTDDGRYMLTRDYEDSVRLCKMLLRIAKNFYQMKAAGEDPVTDEEVEALLSDDRYTEEQRDAIRRILDSPIMLIQGAAGSGKTEILEKAVNNLLQGNCIVSTFIGYHACNLRKDRIGSGVTLHSMIAKEKKVQSGKKRTYSEYSKKLAGASAIVIDELCNVAQPTVINALEAAIKKSAANSRDRQPITRLLAAGDPQQIAPIGVGQIGADLFRYLPGCTATLTKNVRVEADSRLLVTLDRKMLDGGDIVSIIEEQSSNVLRLLPPGELEPELKKMLAKADQNEFIFLSLEKVDVAYLSKVIQRCLPGKAAEFAEASDRDLLRVGWRFMIMDKLFEEKVVTGTYKSAEVRNGQYFTVKKMFIYNAMKKKTYPLLAIPKHCPSQDGIYMFVDCEDGTRICVHERFVDPYYINPSYSATVNKLQGGQAPHVVCYLPMGIAKHRCWNRSHLHVIFTRAQRSLTLFADTDDLRMIALNVEPARKTALSVLLPQIAPVLMDSDLANTSVSSITDQLKL